MKERGGLSILDALENLNTLVDAESLEEIEVTDDALLLPHKGEGEAREEEAYWPRAGPDEQTLMAIKETFRSVHSYLQTFYAKMRQEGDTKRLVEGINTIMVLVGEAARKLDNFGVLFKSRVHDFEEYRELQDFYRNRVIKESFRDFARVPIAPERPPLSEKKVQPYRSVDELAEAETAEEEIQELLGPEEVEEVAGVHILNDLELIKQDHLYELFYLKNEAGHNFYTPELARNIKLACNFGEFAEEYFGDDPLLQIKNWEDKTLHLRAVALLQHCSQSLNRFYKEAKKYRDMELVGLIQSSMMALMLAANPRNLIRQFSLKGCYLYFKDFLLFLRQILHHRDYEKFLIYSPPPGKPFFQNMLELIQLICFTLCTQPIENQEIENALKKMIEKTRHHIPDSLSEALEQMGTAVSDVLKKHPNGPVFKAVDVIRDDSEHLFDPLVQGNLPEKEWELSYNSMQISVLRMPCPIFQEMIDKAYITEEFKAFLRALKEEEHLLFINFQDRTSWREHARCLAIEELSRQAEFANVLTVVTLAKDTDFYTQEGLYEEIYDADVFIDHFFQHLGDEITGYYFPQWLKKDLFPTFIPTLLKTIHDVFFEGNEKLSKEERLNFVELAYHFLELKLIEITNPTFLTLGSKDGLDVTATSSVGLIALLGFHQKKEWKEEEIEKLNTLLFGTTLIHRERAVHPERFDRVHALIQLLEQKPGALKAFKTLYQPHSLQLKPHLL